MINYNRLGCEIKRDFTSFSVKISQKLKRPQQKFVHQMVYGILAGNKLHLSENARSLKENITLKKTIDRLSRNLNAFDGKQAVMQDYLSLAKQHAKEDYAVIVIDNSDIVKPASRKLEELSEIRDGSTGEVTQGYLTIEGAVLSEPGKMPLSFYEKVFSAVEEGFVSETHENLCCLLSLSENFSPKCVRTLDRGFDANDYYRYFLKRGERFVIRAKRNRNVIYNGKTCNIMDVALKYKGAYRMDFKDKSGKNVQCKMSCMPVRLCEFPARELVLAVVYGFGEEPMLLLSNFNMQEKKKLCHIIAKVYLLRWRPPEYFQFKKQQFELEHLRVMSLQSIRILNFLPPLRLISSQKERDFVKTNYDDIKLVYSIWICMNMEENSMDYVHLINDRVLGSSQWEGGLDLLNIVLIGIASELPEHDDNYELHRLLSAMLSVELSTDEKLGIMETEYNIPINDKIREDVNAMCNLSQGIREKGRAEGRTEGRAQGGMEKEEKIILNMYTNHFTLEQIALATGRGMEDIRAVIEKKEPELV